MKTIIRQLQKEMWNIPNMLTMLRIIMTPFFAVALMKNNAILIFTLLALASISDLLDGWIARKTSQITSFGKLIDPLADKILICTAFICQAIRGVIPSAAVLVITIKECFLIIGGIFMLSRGVVVHSNYVGKTGMVLYIVALLASLFHDEIIRRELMIFSCPLDTFLLWISTALSIIAMLSYCIESVSHLHHSANMSSESLN